MHPANACWFNEDDAAALRGVGTKAARRRNRKALESSKHGSGGPETLPCSPMKQVYSGAEQAWPYCEELHQRANKLSVNSLPISGWWRGQIKSAVPGNTTWSADYHTTCTVPVQRLRDGEIPTYHLVQSLYLEGNYIPSRRRSLPPDIL